MAFFGFKSKKEVEAEKQQAADAAVQKADLANKHNVGNLGRGSQFDLTIPFFDAFDPRLQETGVPVAVDLAVVYAIEDMDTFLSMNKMEKFEDRVFQEKLRAGVTKYVKSAVSNAPSDAQIPLVQIERKVVEVSDYVQDRVIPQVERVFGIKVRSLDIKNIRIDKNSRGFRALESLTSNFEQKRILSMQNAQLENMNLQNQMQNDQLKMQQEQMRAQHNAQMSNFNMQNALNLDAMQRQHEMQLGGQEKMQQMQFDMQQKQMNMQLNNQNETMRVQREEMQRAARLQTESTFLDAHKANLNAKTVNNAMDNGFNPYEQQQPMNMGGMPTMNMGGMQQPMMGGMMGQKSMMNGMQPMGMPQMGGMQPMVSYMMSVNGQQAGPYNWAQLQQLVQQGQLTQQSYVWKQGMAEWTPAGMVQELAPLFQGMAPCMPGMPQMM